MRPIFLPKVRAVIKLTMQVRIPPPTLQASTSQVAAYAERRDPKKAIRYRGV